MTDESKKEEIKLLVKEMLLDSYEAMTKKVERAVNSGAFSLEDWEKNNAPMIIPKCIVAALLEQESQQYEGRGTGREKQIKKQIRNIRYFI